MCRSGRVKAAELEAGGQVGDHSADLARPHGEGNGAFVVEGMAKAIDAVANDLGAGPDGGHFGVAGEERDDEDGAGGHGGGEWRLGFCGW